MTVAAFERYALVPLGDLDQVAVVDLQQGTLVQRIPLPPGAGAAGAIMLDDVIGYVANSRRNTISQINALTEHIAEIPVGVSPQGFAFARGRLFVLNGNLDSTGEPVGASWLTVINPATNALARRHRLGSTDRPRLCRVRHGRRRRSHLHREPRPLYHGRRTALRGGPAGTEGGGELRRSRASARADRHRRRRAGVRELADRGPAGVQHRQQRGGAG